MTTQPTDFIIERTFDAPRTLLWEAFSNPDHLVRWWGPKGFQTTQHEFDFVPGGHFLYRMSTDNNEMWGRFTFREIVPEERVVLVNSFSNPRGEITRAPFLDSFPLEVLITLSFIDEGERSSLRLLGQPIHATDQELATYRDMHGSMQMGFGNSLDQLAHVLEITSRNPG